MRCEDGQDDAAYVLGALSPAERTAYERHLATCSFCREAVADLNRVPDLLSRMDADEFARMLDPSLVPPRRRYRAVSARLLGAAAAVLAAVIGIGLYAWSGDAAPPSGPGVVSGRGVASGPEVQPGSAVALGPAGVSGTAGVSGPAAVMASVGGASPVAATVRLAGTAGGTKVEMRCAYSGEAQRPSTFRLIAYGPDDEWEQLGSWLARPGADFSMQGTTHFAPGGLSRLELVRFDGKVLLAYDVP